ncbi:MAG: hypothetical protein LBF22_06645 [Deltaproteobacteria bacterium]|jgi:hypothetical protein|nr:hypothetical protein [Deltaproteobacteria bacterium]
MSFVPFKVLQVQPHPVKELFAKLRKVVMLLERDSKPYEKALLTLKVLPYAKIHPAQLYVLEDNLQRAQCLEWELARFGYNLFKLPGYLTIQTDQSQDPIDLLPPIIERTREADGSLANIVNDGMHRLYLGRLEWKPAQVVLVENLPPQFPYYAYPVPGLFPWEKIQVLPGGEVPLNFIKKWHRIPNNKALYRDFNSAFQNVGGPRGGGVTK